MKKLSDILPKITQWESIPYANDLCCQDCGECGFDGNFGAKKPYPRLRSNSYAYTKSKETT